MCVCLFEEEKKGRRGSACKTGEEQHAGQGETGLMVFFKEGDEGETGEAFLRLQ